MGGLRVLTSFVRGWSRLSTRGLDASDRAATRAVIGANNFYLLTALANIPWAIALALHDNSSYVWPAVTHLAMIAVWMISYAVNKRGYTPWMSGISLVVTIAQFTWLAAVYSLSSGFQLGLFVMPTLAFSLFVPSHWRARAAIVVIATVAALWLYLNPRFSESSVAVSQRWETWSGAMMVVSVVVIFVAQASFNDFYFNRERRRNMVLLAEARVAAHTDSLTHLLNRRGVGPKLTLAAQSGPYSVALADLDRFKRVNDVLGHGAGDLVLAKSAATLEQSVGDQGFVARWGGEEFLVVLPGLDQEQAEAVMERARVDLEERFRGDLDGGSVTMSVGVVAAPQHSARDAVLRAADHKLYEAKASGRNIVVGAWLEA